MVLQPSHFPLALQIHYSFQAFISLRFTFAHFSGDWLAGCRSVFAFSRSIAAEVEAQGSTYVMGVTDGLLVWAIRFSRIEVSGIQWQFGPGSVLTAPSGDANSVFNSTLINSYSKNVSVMKLCSASCAHYHCSVPVASNVVNAFRVSLGR